MEANEWDSILQFVVDGLAQDTSPSADKPASSIVRPPLSRSMSATQISTTPVLHGTPAEDMDQTMISVSTTFFPGAELDMLSTDLIILSSDSVFFYIHSHKILAASSNGFNSLLPLKEQDEPDDVAGILPLHLDSVIVNILLHTIYNMSATHYAPSPEAVIAAVDCFETYAPRAPIEFYAVSGAYDVQHLAIPISSFLLSYSLATLTDELAVKMGPLYLKRLFFLHLGRVEALKRLLLPPPQSHVPTANCDFTEQKKLTRAWALASAYLAWDVRPDLTTHAIEAALRPLGDYLACDQCNQLLRERINNLVAQWSIVKRTV
ncbi:hypothetical protein BC827DRAFT_396882 [Russula dissimulans]|nr:hypothetical protein BC827DRAFT_396882 [Russula dissimulans]